MRKTFMYSSMVMIIAVLSSFVTPSNLVHKRVGGYQIGYFIVGGQEYDAYADTSGSGPVTDVYKTDNNGNDVSPVTVNSGTHSGHNINVTFTDGSQHTYTGTCYF